MKIIINDMFLFFFLLFLSFFLSSFLLMNTLFYFVFFLSFILFIFVSSLVIYGVCYTQWLVVLSFLPFPFFLLFIYSSFYLFFSCFIYFFFCFIYFFSSFVLFIYLFNDRVEYKKTLPHGIEPWT